MSETTIEVPTAVPQRWQHRRTVVTAMRYDGTDRGRTDLVRWVNAAGGQAQDQWGDLLVKTQVKWAWVPTGFWVGLGYVGQFWVISHEVFVGCYDPAEGENRLAVLDRDTAAAMVVSADEMVERAETDGAVDVVGMLAEVRVYVHQLATSLEALR